MSPTPEIQQLNDALDAVDNATTMAATATTAIAARIQKLLDQIAAAPTLADTQALVQKATAEVAKLQPVADALTAMGTDPATPVPTPVPSGN
jgi:hypothetical protein